MSVCISTLFFSSLSKYGTDVLLTVDWSYRPTAMRCFWFLRVAAQHRDQAAFSLPLSSSVELETSTSAFQCWYVRYLPEYASPWLSASVLLLARGLRISSSCWFPRSLIEPYQLDCMTVFALLVLNSPIVSSVINLVQRWFFDIVTWTLILKRNTAWLSGHLQILVTPSLNIALLLSLLRGILSTLKVGWLPDVSELLPVDFGPMLVDDLHFEASIVRY